ncbi:MAG: hypothetical protein AAF628_30315 [Planctomycetota bacterium]
MVKPIGDGPARGAQREGDEVPWRRRDVSSVLRILWILDQVDAGHLEVARAAAITGLPVVDVRLLLAEHRTTADGADEPGPATGRQN